MKRLAKSILAYLLVLSLIGEYPVSVYAQTAGEQETEVTNTVMEDSTEAKETEETTESSEEVVESSVSEETVENSSEEQEKETSSEGSETESSTETSVETTEPEATEAASVEETLTEEPEEENVDSVDGFDMILKNESLSKEEKEEQIKALKERAATEYNLLASGTTSEIGNDYLEIAVGSDGLFTIGTVIGNPDYTSDDGKKLLYGHPSPWSSKTLIHLEKNGRVLNTIFKADSVRRDSVNNVVYADMTISSFDVTVIQKLEFVTDNNTGRDDTVKISYSVNHEGTGTVKAGVRIMMDTMLASHDDAPFKIPGIGNLIHALELSGSEIPQTYQVYDVLDNPTTLAQGTLYLDGEIKPAKVQFGSWGALSSTTDWNYTVDENFYFGDSAVAIYFDPVSLNGGQGIDVCTYYGTGLNFYRAGGSDIDTTQPIGNDEYAVYVVNTANQKVVQGATVTIDGVSVETDANGRAVFTGITDKQSRLIKITHTDYVEKSIYKVVSGGRADSIAIKKSGETIPIVESVKMTSTNPSYNGKDLLSDTVYFNSNKTDIKSVPGNTDVVTITATTDVEGCTYRLVSNNDVVMQNDTGIFKINTIKKDANGNVFTYNRICDFEEGNKIYLVVVSPTGEESSKTLLGIKVSMPSSYSSNFTDKVEFSSKIKLDLPDEDIMKILLGDEDYEVGPDLLPIEIEIDQDGKVKVAINKEKGKDWSSVKEDYQKAILQRSNAAKAFGGKPVGFGAGDAKLEMSVTGYGEGYLKDGGLNVNVGIVVAAKGEASYTHTFFVGWVPLYLKVGAELGAEGTFEAGIIKDTTVKLTVTQGKFEPSVALYAELGAGASGLLSAGVQGKGTLKYSADFARDYYTVTLQAKASVEVHAVLLHKSFDIAQKTWTLYDSNRPRTAAASVNKSYLDGLYDISTYEVTPRDYLDSVQSLDSGSTINSSVYVDAKPVMVYANGKAYRFWLEDNTERNLLNRTNVVYSVKAESGDWSEPVALMDDGKADYNFDVAVNGDRIYIVSQHSNTIFDEAEVDKSTVTDMIASSDICYLELDTTTNTVSQPVMITQDETGDLVPKIAVNGTTPVVAWYTNSNNVFIADGTLTEEEIGNTILHYAVNNGSQWEQGTQKVIGNILVSSMDIGILDNNVSAAYVLDTDSDYSTLADRELYMISDILTQNGGTLVVSKETSDVTMDENPKFVKMGSEDALIWCQEDNYRYTTSTVAAAQYVFASESEDRVSADINCEYAVVEGDMPMIVWTDRSYNDDSKLSIFATEYKNGSWSGVYEWERIDVEDPIISYLSGYSTGGKGCVSYQVTQYGEGGAVLLSELRETSGAERAELQLVAFDYDMNDAIPGAGLEMDLTLYNSGNTDLDDISVVIGSVATSCDGTVLEAGETESITLSCMLPEYSDTTRELTIYVEDETAGVVSESDVMNVGYTDIEIELGERVLLANTEYMSFILHNNSNVPASDVKVKVLADDYENGTLVFDYACAEDIPATSSITLLCPMEQLTECSIAYVKASTSTDEWNALNNETMIVLDGELPDMVETNLFSIRVESEDAGSIVVDDTYQYADSYETNTEIPIKAVPNDGYVFTHWESVGGGTFTDSQNEATVFIMPNEAVEVIACFATVNRTQGITIPQTLELGVGEGYLFAPTVTPADVKNSELSWESSDSSVVSIDNEGYILAQAKGEAIITVRAIDNDQVVSQCVVTVTDVATERIRFVYPLIELDGLGATAKPEILIMPENSTLVPELVSQDTSIIRVKDDLTIEAVGLGETTLVAKVGELSAECRVVVNNPISRMEIIPNQLSVELGTISEIDLNVYPVNATNMDDIEWTVVDNSVATVEVSEDGKKAVVSAVGKGVTYIRARAGSIGTSLKVNVYTTQTTPAYIENPVYRLDTEDALTAIFDIDNISDYEGELSFNLYSNKTTTSPLSYPSVSLNEEGKLQLTFTSRLSEDECYYLSVKEGNRDESIRTELTVRAYKPFEIADIKDQIYNGKPIKPGVTVKHNGTILRLNQDYTITYPSSCTNASSSAYTLTVTGMEGTEYEGLSQTVPYKICYNIGKAKIRKISNVQYTGSPVEPSSISVTYKYKNGKRTYTDYLYKDSDYEVVLSNNVKIGTATIELIGKGMYTGSIKKTFKIVKRNIRNASLVSSIPAQYYDGKAKKPVVVLTDYQTGLNLVENVDYTISYKNNVKVTKSYRNRALITVKGKGIYQGTWTYSFYIYPQSISNLATVTVGGGNTAKYNNGKPVKPGVVVTLGNKTLKKNKDYRITGYSDNRGGIGTTGTVNISFKGNYSGYVSAPFTIVGNTPKSVSVTLDKTNYVYNGQPCKPNVTVKVGGNMLAEGEDYYLVYSNYTNVGTATVTVVGTCDLYKGSKTVKYKIAKNKASVSEEIRVSEIGPQLYTSEAIKPAIRVYDGSDLLVQGVDYTVKYNNNVKLTTDSKKAKAIVTFKGNYSGTKTVNFDIVPWNFNEENVSVYVYAAEYTGKLLKPQVQVVRASDGYVLKSGKAYKVTYANNIQPGNGTVTVTPLGVFAQQEQASAITCEFIIKEASIGNAVVKSIAAQKYDGTPKKPLPTVTFGGKKLKEGEDYTLRYRMNVNKGIGYVDILGKGNFIGSKTVMFGIK